MALVAITDAKLDPEIDRETDKQHAEGDRDQIERADRQGGKARGQDQPAAERQQHRADQPCRAQSHEHHRQHRDDRQQRRTQRAFLQGRELLVAERDGAGQAHSHPVRLVKAELGDEATQFGPRLAAGLQPGEIEDRAGQHETAKVARLGRAAGHHLAPIDRDRLVIDDRLHRGADRGQGGVQLFDRDIAPVGGLDKGSERAEEPAQARIARQAAHQRLGRDKVLRYCLQLGDG